MNKLKHEIIQYEEYAPGDDLFSAPRQFSPLPVPSSELTLGQWWLLAGLALLVVGIFTSLIVLTVLMPSIGIVLVVTFLFTLFLTITGRS